MRLNICLVNNNTMKLLKLCIIFIFSVQVAFSQNEKDKASLGVARNYLLQGNYQSCQNILFPTFLEIRKTQGENNADYQEALSLLADLVTKMGYYTLAERIALKELSQAIRIYGVNNFHTANAYIRLGDIARCKTDYFNASVRYEQAYDIAEALKDNELLIVDIQIHQGRLSTEKGEYTAAEALLRRAKTIYQKLELAPSDIRQIELNEAYSNLFFSLRNYTKAIQLLENNLFQLRNYYHASHPKITENHYLLAEIYLKIAGQNTILKEKGKAHIDSAKRQAYSTPELYLIQKKQEANIFKQQKDFAKADTIYRQLLENSIELTGEHSRLKMDFMLEEAQMYYLMGNMEECIALYEHIEDLQKEYLSITHPDYLRTQQDLSMIYWAIDNYKKSHRYFRLSAASLLDQFQRATSFMSEQEKALFYEKSRLFFDRFNAFILANYQQHAALSREMYDYQLQTKAMLFTSAVSLREKVFATQDSTLIRYYFRWLGGKEQLAKTYKLTNEGLDISSKMLDSLENTLNDLEKSIQLKITLTDNKQKISNEKITVSKLRQKLAPDEAAIEIIRVEGFNPKNGGQMTDTIYYVALILTTKMANPELILLKNGKQLENQYAKFYKNTLMFKLKDTLSYNRFW
ncbi:MAG: tetratricopeptide repeat protein, partial [Thermoflexibacter sp.]|nr:tetratricopeptide repeat protein [Thermoflexibacter sp.]